MRSGIQQHAVVEFSDGILRTGGITLGAVLHAKELQLIVHAWQLSAHLHEMQPVPGCRRFEVDIWDLVINPGKRRCRFLFSFGINGLYHAQRHLEFRSLDAVTDLELSG